jgi:hypothetical protein
MTLHSFYRILSIFIVTSSLFLACDDPPIDVGNPLQCSLEDGSIYAVGDTFIAPDGCNTCLCVEGGIPSCTKMACPNDCSDIDCEAEGQCEMTEVCQLDLTTCSEGAYCVGPNTCRNVRCTADTTCKMIQVQCITTPCYPLPQCVPNIPSLQ